MAIFDKEAKIYDEWYKSKLGNFVDEAETRCVFDLFKAKKRHEGTGCWLRYRKFQHKVG